ARRHDRRARARARSARQRQGRHAGLSELQPESVRGRRHAARPVVGGVGDPRGPPSGACRRQVLDGIDDAAALSGVAVRQPRAAAAVTANAVYRKKFWKKNGERWAFQGLGRARGRRWAGFCSEVGLASLESEVRAPAAGFVGFASGASGAAAGSAAAGWALSALPRGQLKSSARPPGAATGSPLLSTRE